MPIRLLGLKTVRRMKLSQHLAAASVASLALSSFHPSQGSWTGCVSYRRAKHQPRKAQLPLSPEQHSRDQPGQCALDKAASSPRGWARLLLPHP